MPKSWLKPLFALLLLAGVQLPAAAQTELHTERLASIQTVIDAYNLEDYKGMQKPFFGLGKLVISKKALRREFEPLFQQRGTAHIDTVYRVNLYEYIAQLKFQKGSPFPLYLQFIFGEKEKVEGMGFTAPPYLYRRSSGPHTDRKAQLDSLLLRHRGAGMKGFNGCIQVRHQGEVIYQTCEGWSEIQSRSPLSPSTRFDLASCSKQFTATLIMRLQEKGLLDIEQKVDSYLPGFPYPEITLQMLLHHSSGLPEYFELLRQYPLEKDFVQNQDVLDILIREKPKTYFTSGTRFYYCNTGYLLLALIAEQVGKKDFATLLQEEIFAPLQMEHTRLYNTRRSQGEQIDNFAFGYVQTFQDDGYALPDSVATYRYVIQQDAIKGDGALCSSLDDLGKWLTAIEEQKLLSQESWQQMTSRHRLPSGEEIEYGLGFFVKNHTGLEKVVYHTGGWPGYLSLILTLPDQDLSLVILSNNSYDPFLDLADQMLRTLLY